jgi:hypothetical protein
MDRWTDGLDDRMGRERANGDTIKSKWREKRWFEILFQKIKSAERNAGLKYVYFCENTKTYV